MADKLGAMGVGLSSQGETAADVEHLALEDVEALREECSQRVEELETALLDLADNRIEVTEEYARGVFRALHAVSSAAGYLQYERLEELAHAAENVLAEARNGRLELTAMHGEALLAAVDDMKQILEASSDLPAEATGAELARLSAFLASPGKPVPALSPGAGVAPPAALGIPPRMGAPAPESPLKVLVVEDDFSTRLAMQGILSQYGECHIAVNGREALEAFQAAWRSGHAYDLVCMDIQMPEMDGAEAVRRIREFEEDENVRSSRGAKIFMTTQIHDIKTITASFKALCDAYLFKPIEWTRLDDHLLAFGLIAQSRQVKRRR